MATNALDYVGKSLLGKHIVLLHEDPKYAELIRFSYLHSGLEQEKICVYLTYQEKALTKRRMSKRGLDVAHYEKKGQLRIVRIYGRRFRFWSALEQLARDTKEPRNFRHCRIVWLFDKKPYDKQQLSSHIEEDAKVQSSLEGEDCSASPCPGSLLKDFNGSILCSYPINQNYLGHPQIIRHHLNNHDGIILAPKHGIGAVLQSNGLKKSDMEAWIRNKLEI